MMKLNQNDDDLPALHADLNKTLAVLATRYGVKIELNTCHSSAFEVNYKVHVSTLGNVCPKIPYFAPTDKVLGLRRTAISP